MRILVTGGAGFIGSHVVDAYFSAGHEVAVLDDFSAVSGYIKRCDELYIHDIRDRQAARQALRDFRPDVVNHHAAMIDVVECEQQPDLANEINVEGTRILLEEAIRSGVKKFIFASSGGAIYGECPKPARETDSPHPCGVYGHSKLVAEQMITAQHRKVSSVILRYANVYGLRGDHGVIPAFMHAANKGELLDIYGDGKQVRDFIHVSDVVQANLLALGCEGGIFNVGTGEAVSIDLLARLIGGEASQRRYLPAREGEIRESRLDVSLAKRALGFEATRLLSEREG